MTKPIIIAVASGKGGVGKSLITANLAIALANDGHQTIAIDLDLGGSNLHSYLGIPNKYPGIGDYLIARHGRLEDLMLQTSVPNLSFIPGDVRTPCMANIAFSEKVRLMLAIRWLKAKYILIDLGGGSGFNTLDFFALSEQGLMVTTPEYPSLMNLLVFLRNFLFRAFDRQLKKYPDVYEALQDFRKIPTREGQLTIEMMVEGLEKILPEAGAKARQICRRYQPRILYNFCLLPEQLKVSHKLDESSHDLLSMSLTHFGSVFEDRCARESTYRSIPLLPNYPESSIARRITSLAARIVEQWEDPLENSAHELILESQAFYQDYRPL
ncbi:P-loop NTPase [Deltaproteobacteria bacterium TL4]